jgi:hypothetical protein
VNLWATENMQGKLSNFHVNILINECYNCKHHLGLDQLGLDGGGCIANCRCSWLNPVNGLDNVFGLNSLQFTFVNAIIGKRSGWRSYSPFSFENPSNSVSLCPFLPPRVVLVVNRPMATFGAWIWPWQLWASALAPNICDGKMEFPGMTSCMVEAWSIVVVVVVAVV